MTGGSHNIFYAEYIYVVEKLPLLAVFRMLLLLGEIHHTHTRKNIAQ